ncbi:hypothetical protein RBB50_005565 [Rhinocladiella similis]
MPPPGGGPIVRLISSRAGAFKKEAPNTYWSSRASRPPWRSIGLNSETKIGPNGERVTRDAPTREGSMRNAIRNAKTRADRLSRRTAEAKHRAREGASTRTLPSRAGRFAQHTSKAKHKQKRHDPESVGLGSHVSVGMTWLTESPQLLKPEILLPQVVEYCHRSPLYRSIALLVTPGLAHFMDRDVFLRPLLDSVFSRGKPNSRTARVRKVRTCAAIVDALPVPQNKGLKPDIKTAEGIALLLTREHFDESWIMHERKYDASETEASSPGSISFLSTICRSVLSPSWPTRCRLTLPLANTLFLNGQQHTMVCDQWAVPVGYLETRAVVQTTHKLRHVSVESGCEPEGFLQGHIPLQALTPEREITQFMGNILAKIEINGVSVPASRELESAVTEFVASNPDHGPVAVYALIRPAHIDDESRTVQRLADDGKISLVTSALCRGAKLHKVTGGGGGWGEKAGLLSIDAADDLSSLAKPTLQFPALEDDGSIPATPKPHDIIERGSTVEFFVHTRERPLEDTVGVAAPEEAAMQGDRATTWVLGTTSHPEALSRPVDADVELDHSRDVTFLPDYFGMLSCGNAALMITKFLEGGQRYLPGMGQARWKTRIDVPDSHFKLKARPDYRPAAHGQTYGQKGHFENLKVK